MPISYPTPLSERIAMLEGTLKKKKKKGAMTLREKIKYISNNEQQCNI